MNPNTGEGVIAGQSLDLREAALAERTAYGETLKKLVKRVDYLPTLPQVVSRMISAMANPSTSAADIEKIISTDQAITAKMLKVVNSSFYSFPRRIGSVCEAVVMLGFNTIRNLAITCSLFHTFKGGNWEGFDRRRFWDHSIGAAVFTRCLGRRLVSTMDGEELFVMGLLHDIGKLVLEQFCPEKFGEVLGLMLKEGVSFYQAEMNVIGISHAEIGRWLCTQWNLPSRLAEAVGQHHEPHAASEAVRASALVHLANAFCHQRGLSPTGAAGGSPLSKKALDILKITPGMLPEIEEEIGEEQKRAESFFTLY